MQHGHQMKFLHGLKCSLLATSLVQVTHCTVVNNETGKEMPP